MARKIDAARNRDMVTAALNLTRYLSIEQLENIAPFCAPK